MSTGARLDDLEGSFADFYATANGGAGPYAWQRRLFRQVAGTGLWPEEIDAPTGAGKTCVIDVHVFVNALAGLGELSVEVPRRLFLTVGRRALVDSQQDRAARLAADIAAAGDGILARTREGLERRSLESLRWTLSLGPAGVTRPFAVAGVRGGAAGLVASDNDSWRLNPTACAVVCMTPDMFGSRLLWRGYGSSRGRRPIEAGLLAYDSVVVIYEAHLNRQLTQTVRRVSELEQRQPPAGARPLQVVTATATPVRNAAHDRAIGLAPSDLADDAALAQRMTSPKPVQMRELSEAVSTRSSVDAVVRECLSLLGARDPEAPRGPVLCVVNTVHAAIRIASALKDSMDPDRVLVLVGRLRPLDRAQIAHRYPGIFSPEGNPEIDIIVATQTVEVGIDLDAVGMVTELAPASALVQRAGRVNRRGLRNAGQIVLVCPPAPRRPGQYHPEDLRAAREWLEALGNDGLTALAGLSAPPSRPRRILQRLESWDVEYLACTSEELSAEDTEVEQAAGLELFLSEDLETRAEASVVVRSSLPKTDAIAMDVLRLMPPDESERFPATVSELRDVVRDYLHAPGEGTRRRAFVVRNGEVVPLEPARLRPDDTVVVDATAEIFLEGVLSEDGKDAAQDASGWDRGRLLWRVGRRGLDTEDWRAWRDLTQTLLDARAGAGDAQADESVETFAEWAEAHPALLEGRSNLELADGETAAAVVTALRESWTSVDVLVADDDPAEWTEIALVLLAERTEAREDFREVVTPAKRAVALDDHQHAVGLRVGTIAAHLRLSDEVRTSLTRAGELHDEGKRDIRFQRLLRLGREPHGPDWAKSRIRSRGREIELRSQLGLRGWRHEQLSAAVAYAEASARPDAERDLVARLVGTTHGWGRGSFSQGVDQLIPDASAVASPVWEAAVELFTHGEWEQLVERTGAAFGEWGVAYLEALLRAADMTISAEGS